MDNNEDVMKIGLLAEQLNHIKNENDVEFEFKDDPINPDKIFQALKNQKFKVKNLSHIIYILSGLKKINIKIDIDQDLCNKLFNIDRVLLRAAISLSDLKLICDFCQDGGISQEIASRLFELGLYIYNQKFFNNVSISEIYSMKKKFSIEAQEVIRNKLNSNRKKLLDKLVSEKSEAYNDLFSKFVFKLYCFQICFCGSLDLNETQIFMKLISGDTINIFVLATYFENEINNKNALPKDFDKKNSSSVKDKNLSKQLFSNSAPELAAKILITHKKNKNKLSLDELKIIIFARLGFENDEDFKNKIKDLSKNEIDDNFWLNDFETIIPPGSEIDHICYLLWLAIFLSKSHDQQNELKLNPDFKCSSNTFQLFKFFLEKNHRFEYNDINNMLNKSSPHGSKLVILKPEDDNDGNLVTEYIKSIWTKLNKSIEQKIMNEILESLQDNYILLLTYNGTNTDFVLFTFEKDVLVGIWANDEHYTKKKDKNNGISKNAINNIIDNKQSLINEEYQINLLKDENEEQNGNNITESNNHMNHKENANNGKNNDFDLKIEVKEQNKNNITESNNQINHKKLKITFIILVAVLIISVAGFFINIFYFGLAVFYPLNIILIALFVLSVISIVALSIAIKNINTPPKNFCLRGLFNCLILSKPEKTKFMDQNLQMQNKGQIKS